MKVIVYLWVKYLMVEHHVVLVDPRVELQHVGHQLWVEEVDMHSSGHQREEMFSPAELREDAVQGCASCFVSFQEEHVFCRCSEGGASVAE